MGLFDIEGPRGVLAAGKAGVCAPSLVMIPQFKSEFTDQY